MNETGEEVTQGHGRLLLRSVGFGLVAGALSIAVAMSARGETDASSRLTVDTRPRLVLLVVIDQFRADYLERLRSSFGNGGFELFFEDGARFTNAFHPHTTTDTCPGHALIATGAWPSQNGIVANAWYDDAIGRSRSCALDLAESLVGTSGPGKSPRALLEPTIGDLIKRASSGRSKVIAVGGKDYATIMLGGHGPDGVWWASDTQFVSSTYYALELPAWVRRFNAAGHFAGYVGSRWDPVPSIVDRLGASIGRSAENSAAEPGKPLSLEMLEASPFHNEIVTDFAIEAIREERLGRGSETDLLAVGLSANDRVGHRFGPDSWQSLDTAVRTDRLLARLFSFVDGEVGLENTLIIVTADHGVAQLPESHETGVDSVRAGRISESRLVAQAEAALDRAYGDQGIDWIAFHDYPNLYFDARVVESSGIPVAQLERAAAEALTELSGIFRTYTNSELRTGTAEEADSLEADVLQSYHPDRSGNVVYEVLPYYIVDDDGEGTNHGTRWPYDTKVPLLMRGPGIRSGEYAEEVSVADIVPTIASLLGITDIGRSAGYMDGGRILEAAVRP